jgi:hypothetical protein
VLGGGAFERKRLYADQLLELLCLALGVACRIEDEFDREQRRLVSSASATAAAERADREQAALDTMNLVLHLPPAPGR